MNRASRSRRLRRVLWAVGGLALNTGPVWACAVCNGDPNSPMSKGAVAGILVLGGFISFVLLGVVGTSLFWIHRSRRMTGIGSDEQPDASRLPKLED